METLISVILIFLLFILIIGIMWVFPAKMVYTKFIPKDPIYTDFTPDYNAIGETEIVCARYNKDISFLDNLDYKYTIVQKDVDVPNLANEASSYLHYIIKRYENLPKTTVFIHDEDESWHHDGKLTERLKYYLGLFSSKKMKYYEFNNIVFEDFGSFGTNSELKHFNEKCGFWDTVFKGFGDIDDRLPITRRCCAQFIVSREAILRHPIEFYQNYYNWLIENSEPGTGGCANQFNPKSSYNTGRYAEWTWFALFNDRPKRYLYCDASGKNMDKLLLQVDKLLKKSIIDEFHIYDSSFTSEGQKYLESLESLENSSSRRRDYKYFVQPPDYSNLNDYDIIIKIDENIEFIDFDGLKDLLRYRFRSQSLRLYPNVIGDSSILEYQKLGKLLPKKNTKELVRRAKNLPPVKTNKYIFSDTYAILGYDVRLLRNLFRSNLSEYSRKFNQYDEIYMKSIFESTQKLRDSGGSEESRESSGSK